MASDSPDFFIFDADVFCEACTEDIKQNLRDLGSVPEHPEDENTFDSGEWPKGPFSDEESDSPQHCGSGAKCLDAHVLPSGDKIGCFLEGRLTSDGESNVREMHRDRPSEVTEFWMRHFDLFRLCDWCSVELKDDIDGKERLCAECLAAEDE